MSLKQTEYTKTNLLVGIILVLVCHELDVSGKENQTSNSGAVASNYPRPNLLSSTNEIIRFQAEQFAFQHQESRLEVLKNIEVVLKNTDLIHVSKNTFFSSLSQKNLIQTKLLKKYFFDEIYRSAQNSKLIKKNQNKIQHYKTQTSETLATRPDKKSNIDRNLTGHFNQHKGKLPLPTSGAIMKASGKPFLTGTVPWNGVLISSQPNEVVKSVGTGKIIFANKFIGFQSVIIVDHGNGYFTIYGNLSPIKVELGQRIEAGQIIGRVGKDRDSKINGLYFEIRKAGTALVSEHWFAN